MNHPLLTATAQAIDCIPHPGESQGTRRDIADPRELKQITQQRSINRIGRLPILGSELSVAVVDRFI